MRVYNLCDDFDNQDLISNGYNVHASALECRKLFYFYFAYIKNDVLVYHRLDGPALHYCANLEPSFYINGKYFSKIDYWNQPEVLEYKYLQKHPELAGFI